MLDTYSVIVLHLRNLTRNQSVLLTHGDSVNTLGEQLQIMGYTSNEIVAALSCEQLKIYGVQFHPEVSHFYEFVKIAFWSICIVICLRKHIWVCWYASIK